MVTGYLRQRLDILYYMMKSIHIEEVISVRWPTDETISSTPVCVAPVVALIINETTLQSRAKVHWTRTSLAYTHTQYTLHTQAPTNVTTVRAFAHRTSYYLSLFCCCFRIFRTQEHGLATSVPCRLSIHNIICIQITSRTISGCVSCVCVHDTHLIFIVWLCVVAVYITMDAAGLSRLNTHTHTQYPHTKQANWRGRKANGSCVAVLLSVTNKL